MTKVVRIERTDPREGVTEFPILGPQGYILGDPKQGNEKHHSKNEVHVSTLEEAAVLIKRGFSLRMGRPGKRGSLISPASLRIVSA